MLLAICAKLANEARQARRGKMSGRDEAFRPVAENGFQNAARPRPREARLRVISGCIGVALRGCQPAVAVERRWPSWVAVRIAVIARQEFIWNLAFTIDNEAVSRKRNRHQARQERVLGGPAAGPRPGRKPSVAHGTMREQDGLGPEPHGP